MTDKNVLNAVELAREHYTTSKLHIALEAHLATYPGDQPLRAAELAGIDHLHTRGFEATVDFANELRITPGTRVLDLGCGLGGPARYLAESFGARVTGLDITPDFIEGARLLSSRSAFPGAVNFAIADAAATPFGDASFDLVWMQHVAMNIPDRVRLYREVARVLRPGGRFASYDVVSRGGDLQYPTPWAQSADASFVLSEEQTRVALESAGLRVLTSRDDTPAALAWIADNVQGGSPPPGAQVLAAAIGENLQTAVRNLGLNYREGRAGVLAIVAERARP